MKYLEVKIENINYVLSVRKGIYKISINKVPFLFFYDNKHAFDMFAWIINTNLKKIIYDR